MNRWVEAASWGVGLLVVSAIIVLTDFHSGEPDSRLYASMVAHMATLPVSEWIAPEWWGFWDKNELFREHPAGLFLLPAVLARLGVPAIQAAYIVNLMYQVASIVLIQRLASIFAPGLASRSLGWMVLLLPVAFMTRMRANHEPAMLMCLLLALYATYRSRTDTRWTVVTTLAMVYGLLIKGVLVVYVPLAAALLLWLFPHGTEDGAPHRATPWLGLMAAVGITGAFAFGYEWAYRQATGETFIQFYVEQWTAIAVKPRGIWPPFQKLLNAGWYLSRYTWYAFPWSLPFLIAIWKMRRDLFGALTAPWSIARDERGDRLRGLALAFGIALLYLGSLSLSDRTMTRYAYPALFVVGACGATIAIGQLPRVRQFAQRLDRYFPGLQVAVWMLAVIVFLVSD